MRVKIESDLHGDMQRPAEMSGPSNQVEQLELGLRATNVSEIPCRVSSDLHEWRNDGHTVSSRDSAKLKCL